MSIGELFAAHGRKFAVAVALGAIVALGVRSMFVEVDGTPHRADANQAADHHAEPGHEGHAQGGAPTAPGEEDEHEGHGEPAKEPAAEGDEEHGAGHGAEPREDPQPSGDAAEKTKPVGVLLDLGNESCPVMGGEVTGKTFTEWNGLRVGHCCPGCNERFVKNPESLLDEVSPKWRDAAKAAKAIDAADEQQRRVLIAQAAKKWRVIREPTAKPVSAPPPGLLIDLGNENCPLMGGEVDGKTFTEWNGLRVGHCCPGCSKRFLRDPESLLDEVSPKWRDAVKAVERVNGAKGEAREEALATLREKWSVVREPAPAKAE